MKRKAVLALSTMAFAAFLTMCVSAHANSFELDGPGVKLKKQDGWFGRKSSSYQDALGNSVSKNTGFFGHSSTRTNVFGNRAEVNDGFWGRSASVTDASGRSLVSKRRTLFHGTQTRVDGGGILNSIKDLFK